jgi:AcrR family transcriptional regulator
VDQHVPNGSYLLREDVIATVLDYGALLLDLESKYFYLLNPSAWAVAQLFEEGASVDHAVARASDWSGGANAEAAVREMVARMTAEGLLQPTDAPANAQGEWSGTWEPVRFERQAEPLHKVIVSAFDPSIPLAE